MPVEKTLTNPFWFIYRDEDMQSIISLMSVNNSDIAPLDDLEDIPDLENGDLDFIMDFSQQMEQMTTSLTGSDLAATPMSSKFCFFLF